LLSPYSVNTTAHPVAQSADDRAFVASTARFRRSQQKYDAISKKLRLAHYKRLFFVYFVRIPASRNPVRQQNLSIVRMDWVEAIQNTNTGHSYRAR